MAQLPHKITFWLQLKRGTLHQTQYFEKMVQGRK